MAGGQAGYAPDCKSLPKANTINHIAGNGYQDKARTSGEYDNGVSFPTKENPGALAGATGDILGVTFKSEYYRNRAETATKLGRAIAECHPKDACIIMEAALDNLTEGHPYYPICRTIDEAGYWADQATRNERKAFALANFTRLSKADQAAFLAYVQRGAAA